MIKIVSWNIDEQLLDKISFEERFYYEEIPKLISVHHKIGMDKARAVAIKHYRTISVGDPDFYRPNVWFEKFKIKPEWKTIVEDMVHHIQLHREAPEAISRIHKKYQTVFVTKHPKEFLRAKLKASGLIGDWNNIFSTVDDLNVAKKDERIYQQIAKIYRCQPHEILHIGDNPELDDRIPSSLGIHTLLLDRKGQKKGVNVIPDLREIEKHIALIDKEQAMAPEPKKPSLLIVKGPSRWEL